MTLPITRQDITGLLLCGGRGSRMGGVDKGLQTHLGQPLAQHGLQRLRPQVASVMISANRHLETYRSWGLPVWPDEPAEHDGPLAGWLAGLAHCPTDWLLSVPCDSPALPLDLAARLASALQGAHADLAVAATLDQGRMQPQPVFCLMSRHLHASLRAYLSTGQRQVERWTAQQSSVQVSFDDAAAFFNANTVADLDHLARACP